VTPPPEPTRRDFLTLVWLGLGTVALAQAGGVVLAFLQPPDPADGLGQVIMVGALDDFAPNSVTYFVAGHFYLYRLEDGGFLALHRRCPHLGCNVLWDVAQQHFLCPCHASKFDVRGNVLNPPAPRALDLLAIRIEGNQVKVDTGTTTHRPRFDPTQVVYREQ
jgi:cytochrome b6-f complex iron-sulfur subunit